MALSLRYSKSGWMSFMLSNSQHGHPKKHCKQICHWCFRSYILIVGLLVTAPRYSLRHLKVLQLDQKYSNYKKLNTVKFLHRVELYHTYLTAHRSVGSLEPGDVVLADRGFTVSEDIALCGARLEIPSFTRGNEKS